MLGGPPGPDDAYVHAGPITHTSGLFVLPFLVAGARQLILPPFDPEDGRRGGHASAACTHTALVPTMVARLLALPDGDADRTARAEDARRTPARPMPPEQIRQAYERLTPNLVQYYGLVEAIPPVTVLDADDHARGLADEPDLLDSRRPAGARAWRCAVVDEERDRPAAGRGRRGRHPRRPRDGRLLGRRGRERPRARPCATAGCTPATSAAWTTTATCGWSTARAT